MTISLQLAPTDRTTVPLRSTDTGLLLLLITFTAIANMALQWGALINRDVAVLTWVADRVLGPAVFGRDVYDVCPPLCFMIYTPAVPLAKFIGFDLAIKSWITLLACVSVLGFWQSCTERLRRPLTITFVLFLSMGFLNQFGQREHVALMLCAPYAAGYASRRGWAAANGVMAGVGFAIKPYFLIPLVLIFLTRRRIRTEEVAIALTGATYAVILLIYFEPYIREFMPMARATYWAVGRPWDTIPFLAGYILMFTLPVAAAASWQQSSSGFSAAMMGFTLAAVIQFKGFPYHFQTAFGFMALFLTAKVFEERRLVAVCAAGFLLLFMLTLIILNYGWMAGTGYRQNDKDAVAVLKTELDGAQSFLSLSLSPFPAFPLVLYTPVRYEGLAFYEIFAPAVASRTGTEEDKALAAPLAIGQAVRELERKPQLVLLDRRSSYFAREEEGFDLLSWLSRDDRFRALWSDYAFSHYVKGYAIYRRREAALP